MSDHAAALSGGARASSSTPFDLIARPAAPTSLLDWPTDVLHVLVRALLDNAEGARALARLCCTARRARALRADAAVLAIRRARKHWSISLEAPRVDALEAYAVMAALMGEGTRLYFTDAGAELVDTDRSAHVDRIAALLLRHAALHAHIEAHTGHTAPAPAAVGLSLRRACHVGTMLAARGVGAGRLHMRGWGDAVSHEAPWPAGPPSRRADVFLAMPASADSAPTLFMPPRPEYYSRVERRLDAGGGLAAMGGVPPALPVCVAKDRHFFDGVERAVAVRKAAAKIAHAGSRARAALSVPCLVLLVVNCWNVGIAAVAYGYFRSREHACRDAT